MAVKMLVFQYCSVIPLTMQNTLGIDGIGRGQKNLLVSPEYSWYTSTLIDLFSYWDYKASKISNFIPYFSVEWSCHHGSWLAGDTCADSTPAEIRDWSLFFEAAGVHLCWPHFKHHLLRSLEQAIPKWQKQVRKRPAWLNRDLLSETGQKRKVHVQWKQGQMTWNREMQLSTWGRKFIWPKLSWSSSWPEDNKRSFLKYIDGNRQCKNNIILLQDDGHLKKQEQDKAEMCNALSVFEIVLSMFQQGRCI